MSVSYRPRNDFIVFRMIEGNKVRGLVMPDIAEQGKIKLVVALGPDVKDLEVGDEVLIVGTEGSLARLPNETDLYLTRQSNVVCVIGKSPESE